MGGWVQLVTVEAVRHLCSYTTSVKIDLATIANGIFETRAGFWTTGRATHVSYPETGHAAALNVEDSSFWFEHRNRVILNALRMFPPAPGVILDVGGGNGYVTKALQDAGFPAVLLEPSAIGAANAVTRGVHNVICGDIDSARMRDDTVGGIGLFDVVEHVEDDVGLLRGLLHHLVPGGRVYVTVPAFRSLWSTDDVFTGHFRRYRAAEIEHTMRQAGFRIEYSTYIFWLLPVPILFFRVIPSKLGLRYDPKARTPREHASGLRVVRNVLGKLLGFEVPAIRQKRRIPIGGSCLVVGSRD